MEIRPDMSGFERLERKRQHDRASGSAMSGDPVSQARPAPASPQLLDNATVQRYVDMLSEAAPERLHQLNELRQRIENGSYNADAKELVQPILDALLDETSQP